ncbi:MAG TPA: DNA recombination protein RmuC [Candidatus Angelobacter sp.]|nr:DNA recombination protein RmuC [Candidatus Angelobacter sp.]
MTGALGFLLVLVGAAAGFVVSWLLLRPNTAVLNARLSLLQQELNGARAEAARSAQLNSQLNAGMAKLETAVALERKANEEKIALLTSMTDELQQSFQALSAEALKSNNQAFLQLANATLEKFQSQAKSDLELRQQAVETLVAPIGESLKKVDQQIQHLEAVRNRAYGDLTAQVRSLIETQEKLQNETGNLVKALRTPTVRGRWGEIQLKRVVEIAGMLPYCDFVEQETVNTANGRLRPDLIVRLPGGKNVVVDAKTPLMAYLDAVESADDDVRRQKLMDHAGQVRTHMAQLSSKSYQEQFDPTPEFVVMFLPGETFFSAALEQEPGLIERGVAQKVIPASPTTLIALLKAVAYGWNQEKLARNARDISVLGKELYDRLRSLGAHFENVGKGLDRAVESYNKAVGSLESRVMVSARKFAELGAPVAEELAELNPIETTTRNLTLDFQEPEIPEMEPNRDGEDGKSDSGTGSLALGEAGD